MNEAVVNLSQEKLEATAESYFRNARNNFKIYRRTIDSTLKPSWWQDVAADELIFFYRRMLAGERPKLVLQAPPQHGKSRLLHDFLSWMIGRDPERAYVFASYSDDLGVRANLAIRRAMSLPSYGGAFMARLAESRDEGWKRTESYFEFVGHRGSFRNTTVGGPITGFGLGLGVIDDPIKSRAEANSKLVRDKTWSWFTNDWFLRFTDDAGMIIII